MQTVEIKGVGKAQFPDDMSRDNMRDFLRLKFSQPSVMSENVQDALTPIANKVEPTTPTFIENVGQNVSDALFDSGIVSDRFGAQRIGGNIASIGEFLPGIGDAAAGDDFGRAAATGDLLGAGLAAAGTIPIAGDLLNKAAGGIAKLDSSILRAMDNKKLVVATVKENTENIARGIEDPVILERMAIYQNSTGKNPVLQFTNARGTSFVGLDGTVTKIGNNGNVSEVFEQDARAFMENRALRGNKKRIDSQKTPEQIEIEDAEFKKRRQEQIIELRTEGEKTYKMQHTAPLRGDNPSGDDVTSIFGEDIYSINAVRFYGGGARYDQKAANIIQSMRGKPDKQITIYRAVPKSVKTINPTDWVSTTKEYAQDHMAGETNWHVLSKKVRAKDIATDGNSLHEFGYDPVKD